VGLLAKAFVDIEPNLKPLSSGLNDAKGMLRGFGATLATLGVGVSAAGMAAGLMDAAKAAADLGEAVSKAKTTFGSGFGTINSTVSDMANRFGLVKTEVLNAAANFGLIAQATGMTKQQSAELASTFTKLAADAASFFNIPMEEALQRLNSGLVGEAEPMRRFGVLLSEDAVKAEALRLGISSATKPLDEQGKVAARVSLILSGMATVTGDLERTQDSAANQMRKLSGDLANFKASFGENFIGPLTDGIKLLRELDAAINKGIGGNAGEAAGAGLGGFFGGVIGGARGILDAGKEAAATAPPAMSGPLGQFLSFLTGAMKQAFGGDQERADRLAGVKVGLGDMPERAADARAAGDREKVLAEIRRQQELFRRGQEELAKKFEAAGQQSGGANFAGFALSQAMNPLNLAAQLQFLMDNKDEKRSLNFGTLEGADTFARSVQDAIMSSDQEAQQRKATAELEKIRTLIADLLAEAKKPKPTPPAVMAGSS
jgi:hypothetical protein